MYNMCVTGHRPNKLYGYDIHSDKYSDLLHALKKCIYVTIKKQHETTGETDFTVYTGMALGVDQLFAEASFAAREYYKTQGINFKVVAAVPCKGQESKWTENSVALYKDILNKCDKVVTLSDRYSRDCMQKRNEYMVNNSDCIFSVWDGSPSGTANCTNYAMKKGRDIIIVDPKTYVMKHIAA